MSDAPAASESTQTVNAAPIGCPDGLGARPPALLNGKTNPEYMRWYRRSKPEKYRKQHDKDQAKLVARRHENGQPAASQTRCVECGMVYELLEAHARGFRMLKKTGGHRCVCDECA